MLKFNIRGENVDLTDAIRDYVEKRISKINKFLEDNVDATAHVNLKVYKNKTFKDMLGHDFFIFQDADTNGTSVVYRRNDGRYGLIEIN